MAGPRRYATIKSAAEYIGSSEKTIDRLIGTGKINRYRYGRRLVRVDLNELDALLSPRHSGGNRATA